jgi:Tfp pilus assembly major pilin PilA
MHNLHKQKGMTAIGWLIVLGLIAFFVMTVLRLFPMYMEYSKVASVMESLANEPGLANKTKTEIVSLIGKRFDINDVKTVTAKQAIITKEDGLVKIKMEYERREEFLGNIDIVGKFSKEIRASGGP